MVRSCIIAIDGDDAVGMSDDDWAHLMSSITDGQFDQLVNAGWALNRGEVDVPFWSDDSKRTGTTGPA